MIRSLPRMALALMASVVVFEGCGDDPDASSGGKGGTTAGGRGGSGGKADKGGTTGKGGSGDAGADGVSGSAGDTNTETGGAAGSGDSAAGGSGGTTDSGGSAGQGQGGAGGGGVTIEANIVFVTAVGVDPDFGGVEGANDLCNDFALAAGLPGSYVAWVSSSTVNAVTQVTGSRGWVRPDGKPVVDTVADILAGNIWYPPLVDENGNLQAGYEVVFTGSNASGEHSGNSCTDWSVTTGSVNGGTIGSAQYLTHGTGAGCDFPRQLLCFGVGLDVPVTAPTTTGRFSFVTETPFAVAGGIAAANQHCQDEADLAGRSETFQAFMNDDGASAASLFDEQGPPWIRFDGLAITPTAAIFLSGADRDVPFQTVDGGFPNGAIWLGGVDPTVDGTAATTCEGWTSTAGATHSDSWGADNVFWGTMTGVTCSESRHLLCLEP